MANPRPSFGPARDYLQKKFGGLFEELESSPVAGVAATSIIPNNPNRLGVVVVNLGANVVYLALSTAPSSTNGIAVAANGGSLSLTVDEDFTHVTRQLNAVSPAGNSQLYVLELVRDLMSPEA